MLNIKLGHWLVYTEQIEMSLKIRKIYFNIYT
jgi:hypothetical protein